MQQIARRPRPDAGRRRDRADAQACSPSSTRATSRSCASARARVDAEVWVDGPDAERQGARAPQRRPRAARLRQRAARVHRARRPRRPALERDGHRLGRRRQAGALRAGRRRRARRASSAAATAAPSILRTALGRAQGDRRRTRCRSTSAEARARAEALLPRPRAALRARPRHRADRPASCASARPCSSTGSGRCSRGDYYVAEATHLFDSEHGLRTEFAVERPGLGQAMTRRSTPLDGRSRADGPLVRRLPGARHRPPRPRRPGPRARSRCRGRPTPAAAPTRRGRGWRR